MANFYTVLFTHRNSVTSYTGTLAELKKVFGVKIKGYNMVTYNGEDLYGFYSPYRIDALVNLLNSKFRCIGLKAQTPYNEIPRLSIWGK